MSELPLTILTETAGDAMPIERLHERTFGPGRFVLSAYRLREHVDHLRELSFTARIGTLLVVGLILMRWPQIRDLGSLHEITQGKAPMPELQETPEFR